MSIQTEETFERSLETICQEDLLAIPQKFYAQEGSLAIPQKLFTQEGSRKIKERLRLSYKPIPYPLIKGKGIKGIGLPNKT